MVPGAVRSGPRLYGEMLKNEERLWVLAKRRPRKLEIGDGLGKKGSFPSGGSMALTRGCSYTLIVRSPRSRRNLGLLPSRAGISSGQGQAGERWGGKFRGRHRHLPHAGHPKYTWDKQEIPRG